MVNTSLNQLAARVLGTRPLPEAPSARTFSWRTTKRHGGIIGKWELDRGPIWDQGQFRPDFENLQAGSPKPDTSHKWCKSAEQLFRPEIGE
jgi:hypothetical protein